MMWQMESFQRFAKDKKWASVRCTMHKVARRKYSVLRFTRREEKRFALEEEK